MDGKYRYHSLGGGKVKPQKRGFMMMERKKMIRKAVDTIRIEHKRFLGGEGRKYYYRSLDMAGALMHLEIIDVDKYLLLADIVYKMYNLEE